MIHFNNPEYALQRDNAEPLNSQEAEYVAAIINMHLKASTIPIGHEDNYFIQRLVWEYEKLKNPWVSVEKALPEKKLDSFLVSDEGENVFEAEWYNHGNKWFFKDNYNGDDITKEVTNWMPIPNLPKKD